MTVLAVMSKAPSEALENAIVNHFPDGHLRVSDTTWFVSASGATARSVTERLGITKDGIGGVVVASLTGAYWGMADSATWEWLKTNFERTTDG